MGHCGLRSKDGNREGEGRGLTVLGGLVRLISELNASCSRSW